jgi:hypothetical protein
MAEITSVERLDALYGQPGEAVTVEQVFFQCARAIVRAELWNQGDHIDPTALPTPGRILAEMSEARVGGEAYDREWPARARRSRW